MKILIITQYYPPEPFRVGDFADGLQQKGCEVIVLTGFPNYPHGKVYDGYTQKIFQIENINGVRVIRVPIFPDTSYSKLKRIANYLSFAINAFIIGMFLIKPQDYQRIVIWQLSPITIALPGIFIRFFQKSKAPIFHYVHDLWPESLEASGLVRSKVLLRIVGILVKFIYKNSNKIIVQSKNMIESVEKYKITKEKIIYIPNWSEDFYKPVPYNEELAKKENLYGFFNIVFAGNLGKAQNLESLLEAARSLISFPEIQFIIYGEGSNRAVLEKLAEDLPNVVFKGKREAMDMPDLLALANITLVTLKREPIFALTIPSKIQSYLACGRPIIAALEGSGADVIREANAGLVCQPDDYVALERAILKLYRLNIDELEEFGKNGRNYYEKHFSREGILNYFLKIFSE